MKKWILRILITVAVLGALALFGLQIVSGTSESHKRGLEQAFSQIFGGQAIFGELKTFNLFPQFTIAIEDLQISRVNETGSMSADQVLIAFGPLDLLLKNRVIEDFHLKNFKIGEGVYTPLNIHLTDAGIYPNEKKDAANFILTGTYGPHELKGQFAMEMASGMRPKYSFTETGEFAMNLGAVQISGIFNPYGETGAAFSKLTLFAQQKDGRIECTLPPEKTVALQAFFKDVLGQIVTIQSPSDLTKLCDTLKK